MGVRLAEGDSRRRPEEPRFALVEVSLLKELGVLPEGKASPRPPRAPSSRARLTICGSSMVASTREWLARICSISVEPARGRPTIKIGSGAAEPTPERDAKNVGVNSVLVRLTSSRIREVS